MSNMLEVADLGHTYGDYEAIGGLTFTVRAGELVCVVGPSGCGKSTLLRTISGLIAPSRGDVSLKGSHLAVVIQDYQRSLFPWLSVQGNVEFPLRSLPRAETHPLQGFGGQEAAVAAFRWYATTCGDRARSGVPAGVVADGRAVRLGGRADPVRTGGPVASSAP